MAEELLHGGEGDVFLHVSDRYDTEAPTVLGKHDNAVSDAVLNGLQLYRFSMDFYCPLGMLIKTKKRPHRLCPARPDQTGKADNLPFVDVEGNIVEIRSGR